MHGLSQSTSHLCASMRTTWTSSSRRRHRLSMTTEFFSLELGDRYNTDSDFDLDVELDFAGASTNNMYVRALVREAAGCLAEGLHGHGQRPAACTHTSAVHVLARGVEWYIGGSFDEGSTDAVKEWARTVDDNQVSNAVGIDGRLVGIGKASASRARSGAPNKHEIQFMLSAIPTQNRAGKRAQMLLVVRPHSQPTFALLRTKTTINDRSIQTLENAVPRMRAVFTDGAHVQINFTVSTQQLGVGNATVPLLRVSSAQVITALPTSTAIIMRA